MIKATAANPLTRAELTALIGEYGQDAYVVLGQHRAKIELFTEGTEIQVEDVEKEGGRLWGIIKSEGDSADYDCIAFLAKDWHVELVVYEQPRVHAEYIKHKGCYRVYDDSKPSNTIAYADDLKELKDHDIDKFILDDLITKE